MNESKLLCVADLVNLLKEQNLTRLCQVSDFNDGVDITICGLCRISYSRIEDRFVAYRSHMYSLSKFEWVELSRKQCDRLFAKIYIYFSKGGSQERHFFRGIMRILIKAFLIDLFKLGYTVSDETKIVRAFGCLCLYEGEDPECKCSEKIEFKTRSFSVIKQDYHHPVIGKYRFTSDTDRMNIENVKCKNGRLTHELYVKFYNMTFHDSKSWRHAAKSLGSSIRQCVNLEKVNDLLKVYKTIFFTKVSLRDYLHFRDKYVINCKPDSLWCLLTFDDLPKMRNYQIFYDGSNSNIMQILKNFGICIARSEIKLLRKQPITYVSLAKDVLYKGDAQYDLFTQNNRDFFFNLLRSDRVRLFPVSLVCKIALNTMAKKINSVSSDVLTRFINVWMEEHYGYLKHYKYKSHERFWENKISEYLHALDWIISESVYLNKNQGWSSILDCVERWDGQRRNIEIELELQELGLDDVKWSLDPSGTTYFDENFKAIELNTPRLLWDEGYEQNHCVYDYYQYCIENRYRVYRIEVDFERATLGLYYKPNKKVKYTFDQLQGYGNSSVTNTLHEKAFKFLEYLNR